MRSTSSVEGEPFPDLPGTRLRLVAEGPDRKLLTETGEVLARFLSGSGSSDSKSDKVIVGTTTFVRELQDDVPTDDVIEVVNVFYGGSFSAAPDFFTMSCVNWLDEETGVRVLTKFGHTYSHHANTHLRLADGRWLRYLVEGRTLSRAVMSAVNPEGETIVRYRYSPQTRFMRFLYGSTRHAIEVVVSPSRHG